MTIQQFLAAISTKLETVTILVFLVLAAACSGKMSPPAALGLGLVYGAAFDNPRRALLQKLSKQLLQLSVVGLGFGMTLDAVRDAGRDGMVLTLASIAGTLIIGWWLGKALKVEAKTSLLVSSGTSICGGSAIAAVGSALNAEAGAMAIALGTIFVLNSLALFVFPPIGNWLQLSQHQFGMWAAIAIHDTSSVVGAAASYGEVALQTAVTIKLARTLWIVPLALGVALFNRRRPTLSTFPWFIGAFVLAVALRTMLPSGRTALRHT